MCKDGALLASQGQKAICLYSMAGAVVVVDVVVVVVKSRNLPLLTLSRYQSAWVFPSKKYDPIVSTDDEKKAYFGAFFLLTYAWNSRWALGN